MGDQMDNQGVHPWTEVNAGTLFDELLGHLLDLGGQRVSVSTDAIVATGVVAAANVTERGGRRWVELRIADNVRIPIAEDGIVQVGWVDDEHAPEREVFALLDHCGERELLIVLER
jgi:hypothetical protein